MLLGAVQESGFQENEVVALFLTAGVVVFIIANRTPLQRLPAVGLLLATFAVILLGRVCTVLEGFLWPDTLNFCEHLSHAVAAVLLALWCWIVFVRRAGRA